MVQKRWYQIWLVHLPAGLLFSSVIHKCHPQTNDEEHRMLRKGFQPSWKPGRSCRKRGYPMIEPKELKWPPTVVGGHFMSVRPWIRGKEKGSENPTQHSYHIIFQTASQRRIVLPPWKSVPCTKTPHFIYGTFRLEKWKIPCYLIVTKRRYPNSKSSGGLPKAIGSHGNQSDFKSK